MAGGATLAVNDCRRAAGGRLFVHSCEVVGDAPVREGDAVTAAVNAASRRRAKANHTATHLLQSALKLVVGEDVSQAGSLVTFDRLRFDFNARRAPTSDELTAIESLVNGWVGDAVALDAREMPIADAKAKGATAMFGEKYGDVVRVVDVPGVSMELCGGTHAGNTAEIGGFKIISEAGIAAGVRRIEAVAGPGVVDMLADRDEVVSALAGSLRVPPEEIAGRVSSLMEDLRAAQKEAEALRGELAAAKSVALAADATTAPGGQKVLVARLDGVDPASLKSAAESLAASRRRRRRRRRRRGAGLGERGRQGGPGGGLRRGGAEGRRAQGGRRAGRRRQGVRRGEGASPGSRRRAAATPPSWTARWTARATPSSRRSRRRDRTTPRSVAIVSTTRLDDEMR